MAAREERAGSPVVAAAAAQQQQQQPFTIFGGGRVGQALAGMGPGGDVS